LGCRRYAEENIMTAGTLFVSFWSLCLDNLPEGDFTRRRITPDDARLAVEQAREGKTLLCLSDTDLLAPYHERERNNHEALCRVLNEHFGRVRPEGNVYLSIKVDELARLAICGEGHAANHFGT